MTPWAPPTTKSPPATAECRCGGSGIVSRVPVSHPSVTVRLSATFVFAFRGLGVLSALGRQGQRQNAFQQRRALRPLGKSRSPGPPKQAQEDAVAENQEKRHGRPLPRRLVLCPGLGEPCAPPTTESPPAPVTSRGRGSAIVAQVPVSSPKVNLRSCASCVLLGGPWRCLAALCWAPGCDTGRKHAPCPGPHRRG